MGKCLNLHEVVAAVVGRVAGFPIGWHAGENHPPGGRNLAKWRTREMDKVDKNFNVSVDTPPPQASINPALQPEPLAPINALAPYPADQRFHSPGENTQPTSQLPGYQPPVSNGGFR